jgi:hypothetical protein
MGIPAANMSVQEKPVQGWLFFFVVWARVLVPLECAASYFLSYGRYRSLGLSPLTTLPLLILLGIIIWLAIRNGNRVNSLLEGFREEAIAFLSFLVVGNVASAAIIVMLVSDFDPSNALEPSARVIGAALGSIIQPVLWLIYFSLSNRVLSLSAAIPTNLPSNQGSQLTGSHWGIRFWLPLAAVLVLTTAAILLPLNMQMMASTSYPLTQMQYEPLPASSQEKAKASIADVPSSGHAFSNSVNAVDWLTNMASRLENEIPYLRTRLDLLRTIHYEATRAGLDSQLVLAMIDTLSGFRKFAISESGARGYMQVHPAWTDRIGRKEDNLFNLRTNIRYGCVILRHYLDVENGDLPRALLRYARSTRDQIEEQSSPTNQDIAWPNLVMATLQSRWVYSSTSKNSQ